MITGRKMPAKGFFLSFFFLAVFFFRVFFSSCFLFFVLFIIIIHHPSLSSYFTSCFQRSNLNDLNKKNASNKGIMVKFRRLFIIIILLNIFLKEIDLMSLGLKKKKKTIFFFLFV